MDYNKFKRELIELCKKHHDGIITFAYGVVFTDDNDKAHVRAATVVPLPVRDEEEEILRDNCAKKIVDLVVDLTKTVYEGR
jgi:hypothetical protein